MVLKVQLFKGQAARWCLKILMVLSDILVLLISYAAMTALDKLYIFSEKQYVFNGLACVFLPVVFMALLGVYKYKIFRNMPRLISFTAVGLLFAFAVNFLSGAVLFDNFRVNSIIYSYTMAFVLVVTIRLCFYMFYRYMLGLYGKMAGLKPTLIIGAGFTGRMIFKELANSDEYLPSCFVDDDEKLISKTQCGLKIYGPTVLIPEICKKNHIKAIIFAIPSVSDEERDKILKFCGETDCEIRIIPTLNQLLENKALLPQSQKIEVSELLGRSVVKFDSEEIKKSVEGKCCLVTGGGGSIGTEICRQLIKYGAEKLVVLDIYENNAYNIQQELLLAGADPERVRTEIASVRDFKKLDKIFNKYRFDQVYHAAAHKHVPLMEYCPEEAVKNNCVGTYNVASLCAAYEVDKMVLISTDKAVRPTNVMGATKRVAEIIMELFATRKSGCEFVTVRFGNVLGSNGSVIPLFVKQIEKGGPVTVTHPEIIRYFMTIPEAVSLVLKAGAMARGGEIFVLDMGKPVKIISLAENLIKMFGLEPYKDIKIEFKGLRPGEKLYEELLMDDKVIKTADDKIFIGQQPQFDAEVVSKQLTALEAAAAGNDSERVVYLLKSLVPEYKVSDMYENKIVSIGKKQVFNPAGKDGIWA